MPHLGKSAAGGGRTRLTEIPGVVPSLKEEIPGCLFAPRCPHAVDRCHREVPPLEAHGPGHLAACWESARLPAHEPRRRTIARRRRRVRMMPGRIRPPRLPAPGDVLLEVRDLCKHFPTQRGLFAAGARARPRGRRRELLDSRRRDARARRRVGLRQVDDRQADPAAAAADVGRRSTGAARASTASPRPRCARSGASSRRCSRTRTRR